jgi:hypothetical protein
MKITEFAISQGVDGALVFVHQKAKCRLIARQGAFYQFRVAVCHSQTPDV